MRVLKKIKIKVPSELRLLDQVLLQFKQIYQESISKKDWLQCQLALVEGFTNAVRHAHKNIPTEVPIEIDITLTEIAMEIRIWDWGDAFDLQGFIKDKACQDDWLGSGRGIAILTKIADRLDYIRTRQERNCLLIVKKFTEKIRAEE